jgi:hypothetical protein
MKNRGLIENSPQAVPKATSRKAREVAHPRSTLFYFGSRC